MRVLSRGWISETLSVLAFPLTFFLTFGLGLKGYITDVEGVPYAIFVVPGLISMTAILAAFDDGSWGMWFHRMVQKTIEQYRVNPITVNEIIIGKIISGFTTGILKGLALGVSLLFLTGFQFHLAPRKRKRHEPPAAIRTVPPTSRFTSTISKSVRMRKSSPGSKGTSSTPKGRSSSTRPGPRSA